MKNINLVIPFLPISCPSLLRRQKRSFISAAALVLLALTSTAFAGSATWKASPATGDWNTATNWTTGGPPNGPSDTATFATSSKTAVSLSATIEVNGTIFNAGASAFTITVPANYLTLIISGVGITNNSGITQKFVSAFDASTSAHGDIRFKNSATAGSSTSFTINGNSFFDDSSTAGTGSFTLNSPGQIIFSGTSSAGTGIFTLNGDVPGHDVSITFTANSTASNGIFTLNGASVSGANGGSVFINVGATAANGSFTLNGATVSGGTVSGGTMYVIGNAGAATVTANGATLAGAYGAGINFYNDSLGGTSRLKVNGTGTGDSTNGYLDISQQYTGVTIGSLEGSGTVELGQNNLTVGANNLSTTFSGIVQDYGTGGSMSKIGNGKLTLTNANTYDLGTTITKGTLIVKNKTAPPPAAGQSRSTPAHFRAWVRSTAWSRLETAPPPAPSFWLATARQARARSQ